MSEFKVGDRVRVKNVDFEGIVDEVLRMEIPNYIGSLQGGTFYNLYRVISEDEYYTGLDANELELIQPSKQPTLEQLEQRIEKLEKCVMGEQNSLEKCVNVSSMSKSGLLTEDERVILRNLDKEMYKWIAREENNKLRVYWGKPTKKNGLYWDFTCGYENFYMYNHLFQFIKWNDKEPYNIEELLKGGNEE